ncbi:unnamed protein product [marine sediment metagenome]|uniref:Uncharacterized protein n=1 Tax=marine sediment metagenome TaxID=412755 RepID=X0TQ11_9ZZZZ
MSEWRLPKLKEDKNSIIQAKNAINNIESVGGILTCLSMEARRNDLGSMAFVLTELADELGKSTEKLDDLVRWVERQKDNEK